MNKTDCLDCIFVKKNKDGKHVGCKAGRWSKFPDRVLQDGIMKLGASCVFKRDKTWDHYKPKITAKELQQVRSELKLKYTVFLDV